MSSHFLLPEESPNAKYCKITLKFLSVVQSVVLISGKLHLCYLLKDLLSLQISKKKYSECREISNLTSTNYWLPNSTNNTYSCFILLSFYQMIKSNSCSISTLKIFTDHMKCEYYIIIDKATPNNYWFNFCLYSLHVQSILITEINLQFIG